MKGIKISNVWNGYCPESLLKGKYARMRINLDDFFESEATGLQICIIPGVQAVILNFRGKGKFTKTENYGDRIVNSEILCPQISDRPPFNKSLTPFGNIEEIEDYISAIN